MHWRKDLKTCHFERASASQEISKGVIPPPPLYAVVAQDCEAQFADDPVAVTACKVTREINLGISVNGRMTAHEEVIEKLEKRIAELEAQSD